MSSVSIDEGMEMLKTGYLSDFKITCNGFTFPVHKVLIARKSEFFKTCVDGKFKETQEATVDLPEEEPVVVALALLYIYCGRLKSTLLYANETALQSAVTEVWPLLAIVEDTNGSMESSRQTIEKLAKLCKLADRLMMDDLLEVAAATLIAAGDPVNSLWYACYVDGHGASEVSRRLLCVLETVYEIVPDNHYLRTHLVQTGFDFCFWQLDCGDVQQSIEDLIKSKD